MCPREKHDRAHGIMNQKQYERSIDEVVPLGATQVVLTGFGEPLLDRKLEQKIAYAKEKGLRTYVITNGSLLHARAQSLADAGLDELRISFYGMKTKSYNSIMQGLDFAKSKRGILEFLEVRKETKVQMSYLVFPNNEHYQEFLDYWEPLVDYIEVWEPHNFGDGKDFRRREGVKKSCGRPENGPLQIQWNGEVVPCCYDYNNQIILGNVFDTPVLKVLYGEKYEDLRDAHAKREFQRFPYCNQCDQLLKHEDVLLYTNRHTLPKKEAVKLSNTDLTKLS